MNIKHGRKTQFAIEGCPVYIDNKGLFKIILAFGETLTAQSFTALTRKVDKTHGFDTFNILTHHEYHHSTKDQTEPFETHTIVGTEKRRNYWPEEFKCANGRSAGHTVTLDTPGNREVCKAMMRLRNRRAKIAREIEGLEKTLVKRNARDHVTVNNKPAQG